MIQKQNHTYNQVVHTTYVSGNMQDKSQKSSTDMLKVFFLPFLRKEKFWKIPEITNKYGSEVCTGKVASYAHEITRALVGAKSTELWTPCSSSMSCV